MGGEGGPNDPLPLGLTSYSKKPGRPRVKSKTNLIDRKRLSNLRESTNFQARSVRREKPLVKQFCNRKKKSFDFLSFEGKRIDFGAEKPK